MKQNLNSKITIFWCFALVLALVFCFWGLGLAPIPWAIAKGLRGLRGIFPPYKVILGYLAECPICVLALYIFSFDFITVFAFSCCNSKRFFEKIPFLFKLSSYFIIESLKALYIAVFSVFRCTNPWIQMYKPLNSNVQTPEFKCTNPWIQVY